MCQHQSCNTNVNGILYFCYRRNVYFLFIALKRMAAFCKKVVSDFRFRR